MTRYTDCKGQWFDLWFEDKDSIVETMYRNMADDIKAGYSYNCKAIRQQVDDITAYTEKFKAEQGMIRLMTDDEADKWCYKDMKMRGAI